MLFNFILKQEINLKKCLLILCSPALLFVFEVDNGFAYIRYFEAVLPMFYIFMFSSIPLYAEDAGMDAFENTAPYGSYKIYLWRIASNLGLFAANIIYNYLVLGLILQYSFNMGEIFIGENIYSGINSGLIFLSGFLSLLFYSSIMNFLQFFLKVKWLPMLVTLAFSIMNLVGMSGLNISAIYYYGHKWLYIKLVYIFMIIVLQYTMARMDYIKLKLAYRKA